MSKVPRFITLDDLWEEFRRGPDKLNASLAAPECLQGHWNEEIRVWIKAIAISFAEFTHRRAQELRKEEER